MTSAAGGKNGPVGGRILRGPSAVGGHGGLRDGPRHVVQAWTPTPARRDPCRCRAAARRPTSCRMRVVRQGRAATAGRRAARSDRGDCSMEPLGETGSMHAMDVPRPKGERGSAGRSHAGADRTRGRVCAPRSRGSRRARPRTASRWSSPTTGRRPGAAARRRRSPAAVVDWELWVRRSRDPPAREPVRRPASPYVILLAGDSESLAEGLDAGAGATAWTPWSTPTSRAPGSRPAAPRRAAGTARSVRTAPPRPSSRRSARRRGRRRLRRRRHARLGAGRRESGPRSRWATSLLAGAA